LDQKPTAEIRSREHARGRGRVGTTDKRGQGISGSGWADRPDPGAEARVRGRGESGRIQIKGLRSDPLELSLNRPILGGRPRSNGRGRTWARWRHSVPRREFAGNEQAGHGGAHGEHDRGRRTGMGALENTDRGGKGSTAAQLTPASSCAGSGAILGEIKAQEGCSPRVQTPGRLENGGCGGASGQRRRDSGCVKLLR
jgi:hypothetical protein